MQLATGFNSAYREPRYPLASQRQLWTLLEALRRGERLTFLDAVDSYQIAALSQRCGELRKLNWPIQSKFVKTFEGAIIKEYWL